MVAQPRGFFIALGANDAAFLILDVLNLLLNLHDFIGNIDVGQVHAASDLIQRIDGFVRQVTVGDVAAREVHTCRNGFFRVLDTVMLFVFVFDVVQNLDGFLHRGGFNHHFLEPSFQSAVFFDVLSVLVQGCGADALDFAPRQGGLEHVGGVQRSTRSTRPDNGVDFINEQDDIRGFLQLVHHGLHALLKLSSVLRACHE